MEIKKLMLFGYDFPHKKTQDFIFRLLVEGFNIDYVVAAPWKKLNIPESKFRISPRYSGLAHPREICKKFNIKYLVAGHNSSGCIKFLKEHPVDLSVISGARILSAKTIEAAQNKVINIHPGLLPEVRGLDTLLWSVHLNFPIGITAHFISPGIDKGTLILRERLRLYSDDTPLDASLRLLEKQGDVLINCLNILRHRKKLNPINLDRIPSPYHSKMPADLENIILKKFPNWVKKFSKNQE